MEEETQTDGIVNSDESRRSFMKKGALASGAVALGVGSSGTATANTLQQQPSQALVFGYEYNPGIQFQVINLLQQGTVNSILARQIGEDGRGIVSDPADYNGYVVRYQPDQEAGEYAFVFVREGSLQTGQNYQFGTDATFFNSQVNLITAGLSSGDGGDGNGGDGN